MSSAQSPSSPDASHSSADQRRNASPDVYSERLRVPLWWWLAAAVVTGVLGYEITLAAHHAVWSPVGYAVVALLLAWLLWSMGRTPVRVTAAGELAADKARLPRSVIARAASIPPTAKSAALGRQLDPAAYLVHRAWVKTMVLLVLDDPDDPTPYWLVSTRRPEELIAALGLTDAREQMHRGAETKSDDK